MTKPRTLSTPVPEAPPPRWASPQGTAAYANVSVRTVTGLIAEGNIPAYKFGPRLIRVDLNDVDRLMVPITSAAGSA